MLIKRESVRCQPEVVLIMSDTAIIAASVKTSLQDIAKQAEALGTGLQNAAPADKAGSPNHSIQYLLSVAEVMSKLSQDCQAFLEQSDMK